MSRFRSLDDVLVSIEELQKSVVDEFRSFVKDQSNFVKPRSRVFVVCKRGHYDLVSRYLLKKLNYRCRFCGCKVTTVSARSYRKYLRLRKEYDCRATLEFLELCKVLCRAYASCSKLLKYLLEFSYFEQSFAKIGLDIACELRVGDPKYRKVSGFYLPLYFCLVRFKCIDEALFEVLLTFLRSLPRFKVLRYVVCLIEECFVNPNALYDLGFCSVNDLGDVGLNRFNNLFGFVPVGCVLFGVYDRRLSTCV